MLQYSSGGRRQHDACNDKQGMDKLRKVVGTQVFNITNNKLVIQYMASFCGC